MCSLESPHRGDSNEYTQHTINVYQIEKKQNKKQKKNKKNKKKKNNNKKQSLNYRHLLPDLASWLTLSGSNYPYLEQISMVPKMFELLSFD